MRLGFAALRVLSRPPELRPSKLTIQGQVQQEDIYSGLPKKAQVPAFEMDADHRFNALRRHSPGFGHPGHLPQDPRRRKMGIQATGRSGKKFGRDLRSTFRIIIF
jgi:hypothetical protein